MTGGRAALIGLMDRYLRVLLDPFVTVLEIHKLMYLMERAGEPLRLGHVLDSLEGHRISGYEDGGDTPGRQIMLASGAVAEPDPEAGKRTRRDQLSRRLLPGGGKDEAQHRSPVRSRLSASALHGLAAGQGHGRAELLEETEVSFWNAVAVLPFGELDKIHEFIGLGRSRSSARRSSPCFAHRTSRRSIPRTPGELMRPAIPQRFTHKASAP